MKSFAVLFAAVILVSSQVAQAFAPIGTKASPLVRSTASEQADSSTELQMIGGIFSGLFGQKTADITNTVYFDVSIDGQPAGRIEMGMYGTVSLLSACNATGWGIIVIFEWKNYLHFFSCIYCRPRPRPVRIFALFVPEKKDLDTREASSIELSPDSCAVSLFWYITGWDITICYLKWEELLTLVFFASYPCIHNTPYLDI